MFTIKNKLCFLVLLLVISDINSSNVRLCGRTLTQFLDMICVDGFNSKTLKAKKSDPLLSYNEDAVDNDDVQPLAFSSIFMDKLYADSNNLIAKTRRRRFDGVADECCRKPCAMSELLSYCQ